MSIARLNTHDLTAPDGHAEPLAAAACLRRRSMRTRLHTLVGAVLAVALAVSVAPALAGKGGNGNGNGGNGGENGNGNNNVTQGSSITLNQAGRALAFGDSVTFTTAVVGLNGTEYPLVYVECRSASDGSLLYGQLDHPSATFVLGGGSSRWWSVRVDAHCLAHLYSYGGKSQGNDVIQELATPYAFDAGA